MTRNDFIARAKINGWNRKATRNELFRLDDSALWADRDAILEALGFAPTQAQEPVAPAIAKAVPTPTPVLKLARGELILKYAAQDCLTGDELVAGSVALGLKIGGGWDFTAEPIGLAEFRKLREAMLLSFSDDPANELDHEDYYILEEFGAKYPRVAAMIGCHVPGLE